MVIQDPYVHIHEFTAHLRGRPIRVVTKPGFARWDQITPAAALLAEMSTLPRTPVSGPIRILVLGSGHGALGVALAQEPNVEEIWLADATLTALQMTERTLQANAIAKGHVLFEPLEPDALAEHFDQAYMELPKGRDFARRWLVETWAALKPGGCLYLAGANKEGVQSIIKDAQALFGNASILGYKKGSRLARMVKEARPLSLPQWAEKPGIKPGTWIEFDVQMRGISLHIRSLPGVFSADRLDEGTAFLLERLETPAGACVLDAGCGYGVIGLFAWKLGAACVDMIDNHILSIACAQENIRLNLAAHPEHLSARLNAFLTDGLSFTRDYGYTHIVSNPPFHAGKTVDTAAASTFIAQARRLLAPGGRLILVANRFLRYDRLMQSLFGNVSQLADNGKYHILVSTQQNVQL